LIPPPLTGPRPGPRPRRGALAALALAALLAAVPAIALRAAPGGPATDVIEGARAQVRAQEAELTRLDQEAGAAAAAHAAARGRAREVRARIRETEAGLREARAAHDEAVERLSRRLVALYVDEPPSLVQVLLTTGDLTETVDAQRALETINEGDARIVASLERTRARLTRVRAALLDQRREADAALATAADRLASMESLLAGRRAVLARATATLDRVVAQQAARGEAPAARRERDAAIDAAGRRVEETVRRRARAEAPAAPSPAPATPAPAAAAPTAPADPRSGVPGAPSQAVLDRIAQCESGGNPRAVSASGQYRGKYQFDQGTWEGVGGTGDPAAASEAEQDLRAAMLYARSGPGPWPVCGYR
jgi:peptidoglycan hydrolase CwlO-like protein